MNASAFQAAVIFFWLFLNNFGSNYKGASKKKCLLMTYAVVAKSIVTL